MNTEIICQKIPSTKTRLIKRHHCISYSVTSVKYYKNNIYILIKCEKMDLFSDYYRF